MTKRTALIATVACSVLWLAPSTARADDEDRAYRFGLVMSSGGGVAGVTHPGPLPGAIGFTDIGAEFLGEYRPWGGFLRADFLSSGNAGRWTTYSFAGGVQYRLFGSVHTTALFLRGGLVFEYVQGNNSVDACPVPFFFPSSCNLLGAGPTGFSTTGEMLGVLAGARVEFPIPYIFLAAGASFVPVADLGSSIPSGAFELRFDLEAGFRDERTDRTPERVREDRRRRY